MEEEEVSLHAGHDDDVGGAELDAPGEEEERYAHPVPQIPYPTR